MDSLKIGLIVLAVGVAVLVVGIGYIYCRILKEKTKHDDRVEILRPRSESGAAIARSARGDGMGSRNSAVSPKQQQAQVATLNSLKSLEDGLSDQDKMAALMAMRQECEAGDMVERQETRALLEVSKQNALGMKSRIFGNLDDYEEDEMLVELDNVIPDDPESAMRLSNGEGYGVDRDAGADFFSKSQGFLTDTTYNNPANDQSLQPPDRNVLEGIWSATTLVSRSDSHQRGADSPNGFAEVDGMLSSDESTSSNNNSPTPTTLF
eukprot:m.1290875 g.1290875  ORF g.1290875 m.1290875 type:complete len:265 (+) comp24784_c0_seq28:495-1289(+)